MVRSSLGEVCCAVFQLNRGKALVTSMELPKYLHQFLFDYILALLIQCFCKNARLSPTLHSFA